MAQKMDCHFPKIQNSKHGNVTSHHTDTPAPTIGGKQKRGKNRFKLMTHITSHITYKHIYPLTSSYASAYISTIDGRG